MKSATARSSSVDASARAQVAALAWRERSARLYEDLRRPARAMIRRAFGSAFGDDEIEDVYGNAWLGTLRALEHRHSELSDDEVRKYVLTAVAHHASKELRRRGRKPTAPLDDTAGRVADCGPPPDERAAGMEESRLTRDLLATLPTRRRAVMLLRYGWGLEPAQVCALVKGLSPRAYRKEITRGVDELTEKLRMVERGEWCADREPVLKAFAAGLADDEQERQARHHLAHCRHCSEFVGRLSGHLHDLGSSLALPAGAGALLDGRTSLPHRIAEVAHRARETLTSPFTRGGEGAADGPAQIATGAGGARGAGAVGSGALAKLAGLGTAGKVAAICLGGGAAVTACLAAGVVPVELGAAHGPAVAAEARPYAGSRERAATPQPGGALVGAAEEPSDAPAPQPPSDGSSPEGPPSDQDGTSEPASGPVDTAPAPAAPPAEQQFGLVPSGSEATVGGSSSGGSGGGKGAAAEAQFGP